MSGKMAKRARAMKESVMTPEEKVASVVHRLCEENSRAVNGLTPQVAFAVFGDVAMRMVYWLESITQQPRRGLLLKEFAAMLDHIARAELGELTDEEKAKMLADIEAELPNTSGLSMEMPATEAVSEANDADKIIPFVPNPEPQPVEDSPVDPSAQG
jgi:hypothetical protein